MTNRLTSFAVMLTALSLGACATITRGTETAWQVNTVPAGASITTSNDKVCEQTPCAIITPRKQTFVATVTKEGYLPQTVPVESRFSTAGGLALLGNVWIGGLIGIFTDTYTGSTHDLTPNRLTLTLEKAPGAYAHDLRPSRGPVPAGLDDGASAAASWTDVYAGPIERERRIGRVMTLRILPDGSAQEIWSVQ